MSEHLQAIKTAVVNGKHLEIEDLNTAEGTFVNDQRLPAFMPWPLRSGDRIKLGAVTFTVALKR